MVSWEKTEKAIKTLNRYYGINNTLDEALDLATEVLVDNYKGRWHSIEDDPDDFPGETETVIICERHTNGKSYFGIGNFNAEHKPQVGICTDDFPNGKLGDDDFKIVAWKRIEEM